MEAASGTSPTRPNIMASKCSSRDGGGHGEEERHVQAHTRSHGGSPWSDAAVAYAIRLAAGTDAEVCILSVLTIPVSYDTPEAGMEFDMLIDSVEQEGKERLLRAATYATRVGVASIILLKWGNIPATILQTADAEACDLIILGSRGLTGWKRLMLGSISNVVAAKASQPVLIVKQHSAGGHPTPPSGGVSWSRRVTLPGRRPRSSTPYGWHTPSSSRSVSSTSRGHADHGGTRPQRSQGKRASSVLRPGRRRLAWSMMPPWALGILCGRFSTRPPRSSVMPLSWAPGA
jgi:nucleotide-binding universal stress UspA family protein